MVSVTRLAAGALLVAACNRTPPPADGHHVVVISIDTLRADHLGCYGHPDVRSPRLDQLASQGALFEHAIAAAPTTLASHTSLLTGRWPHHHGVPRNGFVIDSSNLMLAEVLREAGYQTAAFIGGYPLKDEFAFDQGFETFDQEFPKKKGGRPVWGAQRDAELVDRAVFAWLDQASGDRPLFLFVHYFDVHPPYRTPAPWHDAYLEGPDYGINGSLRDIRRLRTEVMEGRPAALRDSTVLHARYKAGISWTDHHVGVLLDGLEERGILDQAVVVLTSDHGETMTEHPEVEAWNHGWSVYHSSVHVPLIVRLPGGEGGGARHRDLVSLVDVMPTVLDLLDLPAVDDVDGTSFAPLLHGGTWSGRALAFTEATKPHHDEVEAGVAWKNARKPRAVVSDRHKVVHAPLQDARQAFDLSADPGETTDLLGQPGMDEAMAELVRALDAWAAQAQPLPSAEHGSDQTRDALKALGYLDGEP